MFTNNGLTSEEARDRAFFQVRLVDDGSSADRERSFKAPAFFVLGLNAAIHVMRDGTMCKRSRIVMSGEKETLEAPGVRIDVEAGYRGAGLGKEGGIYEGI